MKSVVKKVVTPERDWAVSSLSYSRGVGVRISTLPYLLLQAVLKPFIPPFILLLSWAGVLVAAEQPVRIGLTPVFLDDEPHILNEWRNYLERNLHRPVTFVQRGSYREITDMLLRSELDVAWICGLPYIERQEQLQLVATPIYQGEPLYRSYLITAAGKSVQQWDDLGGMVFTYVDPDSNSGYLYPNYAMRQRQLDPALLFRKTFFSRGHRNTVEAVASGLADAGSVDGYIWDTLARDNPELTRKTEIVERSETFGFPPFVARKDFSIQQVDALRVALIEMPNSDDGDTVLKLLNIDGFMLAEPFLYQSIADMAKILGRVP